MPINAESEIKFNQSYGIIRSLHPDTGTIEWDVLLETRYGYVQLSRYTGIYNHSQGALGEGTYHEWSLTPPQTTSIHSTPPDSVKITIEREYGSKIKFDPAKVAKKLDGGWYTPVHSTSTRETAFFLEDTTLPRCEPLDENTAVIDSTVDENRLILNSVYGPLSISGYDGFSDFSTGTQKDVTLDPFINDNYDIEIAVESTAPGIVESLKPDGLLYRIETNQLVPFLDNEPTPGTRTYLFPDGREVER